MCISCLRVTSVHAGDIMWITMWITIHHGLGETATRPTQQGVVVPMELSTFIHIPTTTVFGMMAVILWVAALVTTWLCES